MRIVKPMLLAMLFVPMLAFGQEYQAERVVLVLPDGTKLDSGAGDMRITGTMSISLPTISTFAQVCIANTCVSQSLSGIVTELGPEGVTATVEWEDGRVYDYSIISLSPLMLFSAGDEGTSLEIWNLVP